MKRIHIGSKSSELGAQSGAVLVESAVFFSFFVLIFFSVFDFAQGLHEINVVTEAARHGARSLASRTTGEKLCPEEIVPTGDTSWGSAVACNTAVIPPESPPGAIKDTPAGSACLYLQTAGFNPAQFEVARSIVHYAPGDQWVNSKTGDNPGALSDLLKFVSVTVRRKNGSSCTICTVTGLAQPSATITLPLNPWKTSLNAQLNAQGFRDGCDS
jgi:hypothetical protein